MTADLVTEEQMRLASEDIKMKYNIKRVILFGSKARGITHKDSDIDFCIIVERLKKRKIEAIREIKKDLRSFITAPIDILVYDEERFNESLELERKLISRYRFGKSQLRPAQVRLAYELVGGKNWEKTIPACASVESKDTGYYCLDDVLDSGADPSLVLLGGVFSSIAYGLVSLPHFWTKIAFWMI